MIFFSSNILHSHRGQASLEAALLIPLLFFSFFTLLQPGIILYDLLVMKNAAAETCRLLATKPPESSETNASYEQFAKHRLAAIPSHDLFHIHKQRCSWKIELTGDETTSEVSVSISNAIRFLPLFQFGAEIMGLLDDNGNFVLSTQCSQNTKPEWILNNELGLSPRSWIEQWS